MERLRVSSLWPALDAFECLDASIPMLNQALRTQGKLLYSYPPPGVPELEYNPHLAEHTEQTLDAAVADVLTQVNTIALYSTAGQTVCAQFWHPGLNIVLNELSFFVCCKIVLT